MRSALSTAASESLPLAPKVTIPLPQPTHTIVFTQDEACLLVGFTDGSVVVYDALALIQGTASVPLCSLGFPASKGAREILPCPGDTPELVAMLHKDGDVSVFDVKKNVGLIGWTNGGTHETSAKSRKMFCFERHTIDMLTLH